MTHRDVIPWDGTGRKHSVSGEQLRGDGGEQLRGDGVDAPRLARAAMRPASQQIPNENDIFGAHIMHLYYTHYFVSLKSLFYSIVFVPRNS